VRKVNWHTGFGGIFNFQLVKSGHNTGFKKRFFAKPVPSSFFALQAGKPALPGFLSRRLTENHDRTQVRTFKTQWHDPKSRQENILVFSIILRGFAYP